MQQLELFDYRKDYLFDNKNQVAHWYDILKETKDTISYAEHIDPNKGYAIAGMEYEEYIDVTGGMQGKLRHISNLGKYVNQVDLINLEKDNAILDLIDENMELKTTFTK